MTSAPNVRSMAAGMISMALLVAVACSPDDGGRTADPIGTTADSPTTTASSTDTTDTTTITATITATTVDPGPATTEPTVVAPPSSSIGTSPPPFTESSTTSPSNAADCVAAMPLAVRVGQVLMPAVYGDALASAAPTLVRWHVGGAILMTWPESATREQLAALRTAPAIPLMIAVDEEGGGVQRLRRLGRLPSARDVASTLTPEEARALIARHAETVAALGIDIVFAPVVDVTPISGPDPIGDRAFSDDADIVAAYAEAYVDGWTDAGVLPVLKHFPGHGSASADTHESDATTPALDQLLERDLVPYRRLATRTDVGVMVGHLDVPGLTDVEALPASLSRAAITGLLRDTLGYRDALVVTDALNMDAVADRFSVSEASLRALAAGADVVLYASVGQTEQIARAVTDAVLTGALPESRLDESVERILRTKGHDPCAMTP